MLPAVAQPAALGLTVFSSDHMLFVRGAECNIQAAALLQRHAAGCRWFILKQGKIFWFKSDVVTPVSVCKCRLRC